MTQIKHEPGTPLPQLALKPKVTFCVRGVTAPYLVDNLTNLRLALRRNGYPPVPVTGPTMKVKSAGKRPLMDKWQQICATADEAEVRRWSEDEPRCTNNGILCGSRVVAVDIDVPVAEVAERIGQLADAMLSRTPLHRIGNTPKSLRVYRMTTPTKKMATPELLLPTGQKVQVEILGEGQQFVANGIHPDTGQPYSWPQKTPWDVPVSELPVVSATDLFAFLGAAEAVLRKAGGQEVKVRHQPVATEELPQATGPVPIAELTQPATAVTINCPKASDRTFAEVNKAALANIKPWFSAIFPTTKQEPGTGAWRVSSTDMGRSLQEDLSVHPIEGGRDFGTERSCSPIDIVVEHGRAHSAMQAALWICERIGVDPTTLGHKAKRERKKRPSAESPTVSDLEGFDPTEDGVALAFAARHRDVLRYCHHTGS